MVWQPRTCFQRRATAKGGRPPSAQLIRVARYHKFARAQAVRHEEFSTVGLILEMSPQTDAQGLSESLVVDLSRIIGGDA